MRFKLKRNNAKIDRMSSSASDAARAIAFKFRNTIYSCIQEFGSSINIIRIFELQSLPAIPDNYLVALIVFRVLFETFFYAKDPRTAASPPRVHSVFMFIREVKGKLRFLQIVLKEMCKSSNHCEALIAVLSENVEIFKQKSSLTKNYWKYFFLKSMMMIRIFQHKYFPSGGDCALVLLCPDLQKKIVEKIEQKSGFRHTHDRHRHVRNYLGDINKRPNEIHSLAIQRLFNMEPNFFSTWDNAFHAFFHGSYQFKVIETRREKCYTSTLTYTLSFQSMRSKKAEEYWIRLMDQGCPELLAEFRKHSIGNDTISWIFYWYFYQMDFPSSMSFKDIMSNLVQPGKMSFPLLQPPKIFSDNCGSKRQETGLSGFLFIPANNVLEICGYLDYHDLLPSAKVLATSFRRKLASKKGDQIICEGLFENFFRPINLKFFVGFVKINYRYLFTMHTLSRKYALEKQNPVLRKYLSRCLDSKFLLRLKNLPFWIVLIRKMVYPHRS